MSFAFTRCRSTCQRGFTLLELTIVLVIIALIVGGVMSGVHVLRNARVGTIMVDKAKYVAAIEAFHQRYNELPGDMSRATRIWGSEVANPNTPAGATACARLRTPSTTQRTCDGDGNGRIAPYTKLQSGTLEYRSELFRMWQHLANSQLLDGQFTGVTDCVNANRACARPGVNTPMSQAGSAAWVVFDMMSTYPTLPSTVYPDTTQGYQHVMYVGGTSANNDMPLRPFITPKEMANIDNKFDDGMPGTGHIRSLTPVSSGTWPPINRCATSAVPATARYNYNEKNLQCVMIFLMPF